jgi:hypothetical protein
MRPLYNPEYRGSQWKKQRVDPARNTPIVFATGHNHRTLGKEAQWLDFPDNRNVRRSRTLLEPEDNATARRLQTVHPLAR